MESPFDIAAAVLADMARDGIKKASPGELRLAVAAYTNDPTVRSDVEQILMEAYLDAIPLDAETAS